MIITCPECDTKYRYDERRFDGEAVKQVKCTACSCTFEAVNPSLGKVDTGAPSGVDVVDAPEREIEPAAPSAPSTTRARSFAPGRARPRCYSAPSTATSRSASTACSNCAASSTGWPLPSQLTIR